MSRKCSQKRFSVTIKGFGEICKKAIFLVNLKTVSLKHTILERKLIETFFFFLDELPYYSKVVRIYYKTPCIFSDIIHNVNGMTT